ncbi:RdgB/HAM1 family non-canonical purine NTP pyrophosphatase [Deinococcus radiodurans]|jgi:non-canonical purine NTP pyrophosphatase, rdgB/HAM1 family|uniref:dITP/XTP pyrophosphatase n=1 Tax=Deinococcus radiodurans (strain ATCC 13939 / DSM 20539 / JCM 16871 / CCUG 27074 / LMG 4051 / NBRC 15346 / NCIMB 9279 / VKM B-1422 / R1) TaxID=243230 RepID=IXTPA_DEIRA|nr:RdgB/HAM1 family non-canonical purine NTP pyrophosphatase [Deinococcus radiodurans]Q9RXX6.1 RecName: Full=dITP/XTP pyrophosphatase; AltName: Full=Non-canonical purine NTP pyrophosphatase; AltName: Full=Non-standard purine NTP pyrophosphatase; AltName: Full=Nucleoside-triphosphate diphosphatase; AltName: Full=Nucleoside-triphosphate pyrophosphatase; Short=NTPase [Deinococcus radiodurans R1 = ATCC 13939 = DSM 20539]AAF09767.1 conserved hypothetical protein [Deinococcus radiodurans R1 = ATCC 1393
MQQQTGGRRRQIRRVVVATSNAGKVRELQGALAPLGWQCEGLGAVTLPEETGSTYEENAALKACAAAMATGLPALADDSGIEVLALGGQPGVYSARFGNVNSDVERNVLLLEKMRRHTDRRAKFVSVLVLAYPDGKLEEYRGEVTGQLLEGPRGESGFGYDPLFLPDGSELSMGEMTLEQKQAISHRGQALAALLAAHGA